MLFSKEIMISFKFCMFKDLEELQVTGCQTDVVWLTLVVRRPSFTAWWCLLITSSLTLSGMSWTLWGRWRQSCGDYSRCLSFGIRAKLIVCYWRKVTFCACFIKYPTLLAQHMWSCLQLSKSVATIQFVCSAIESSQEGLYIIKAQCLSF